MTPLRVLELFYDSMKEISLQQKDVHSVVEYQVNHVNERIQEQDGDGSVETGGHNMAFFEPYRRDWKFYGRERLTLSKDRDNYFKHANRQYQWLLAEAYEEFEIFLQRIYASLGSATQSFWPAEHYGSKVPDALPSLTFDECLDLVKSKTRIKSVDICLEIIRKRIKNFSEIEANNAIELNLRFHTALIAQLRHHIVHTRGYVKDLQEFKQKVLSSAGLWRNGKPLDRDVAIIDNFFRYKTDRSRICLARVPMDIGIFHVDILNSACGFLLSHAYLIATKIDHYISEERGRPVADRLKARRLSRSRGR